MITVAVPMNADKFILDYPPIKVYYFPSNENKVECIYPPPNIVGDSSVVENELLKIYKLLLNSENGEAKELIRHIEKKLKLNSVINKIKTK